MVLKKTFSAAAVGLALIAAIPAQASTITNTNGTFGWTGFDWDSNGTAFTTGFAPTAGQAFTINAFAVATSVKDGATNLSLSSLDTNANGLDAGYEYTLSVLLNESVVSCTGGGVSCTFAITGGTYSIFYDTAANANALAGSKGTGFLDGPLLLSGSIFAQPGGTFTVSGGGGIGVVSILGDVNYTNLSYINPAQLTTTASTTLQLGSAFTNGYVSPGGYNGVAFASDAGTIVFQADANQSFSAVPEPASLALFGIAMLAGGVATRRRVKK